MKNRVLILSISRKVSLVKAFKDAGWYVIGQDRDPNVVALNFCDEIAVPNKEIQFDLAIPTRDAELIDWAGHPATIMPNKETIQICRNKLLLGKELEEIGLKAPKIMFCKPQDGSGSRNSQMMYQEYIRGEEYSIDIFVAPSGEIISIVPRQRLKVTSGESCVTKTVPLQPFLPQVMAISKKLGLIGHSVLQCFLTNSGIVWTDINCRLGGASAVSIKAGCKTPSYLIDLVNGKEVKSDVGNYTVGLIGKSYTDWIFDGV